MSKQRTPNPPAISSKKAYYRDRVRKLEAQRKAREKRAKQLKALKRGGN